MSVISKPRSKEILEAYFFFLADKIAFEIRTNKWTEVLVMKNKGREPATWGSALIWGLFHPWSRCSVLPKSRMLC